MVKQSWPAGAEFKWSWGLRDLLALKHSMAAVHGVAQEGGMLLWQNAASQAMFGCHGLLNRVTDIGLKRRRDSDMVAEAAASWVSSGSSSEEERGSNVHGVRMGRFRLNTLVYDNFIELLFAGEPVGGNGAPASSL